MNECSASKNRYFDLLFRLLMNMERSSLSPGEVISPAKSSRSHFSGLSLRERKDVLVVAIEEQKKHMEEFDNQTIGSAREISGMTDKGVGTREASSNDLFQIMQRTLEKVRTNPTIIQLEPFSRNF